MYGTDTKRKQSFADSGYGVLYNSRRTSKKSSKSFKKERTGRRIPIFLLFLLILITALSFSYIIQALIHGRETVDKGLKNIGEKNPQPVAEERGAIGIGLFRETSGRLSGKTILLDPGHGGSDVGAIYPLGTEYPEYVEKVPVLQISEQVKKSLEEEGANVILLREDDSFVGLYKRAALTHLFCLDYAEQNALGAIPRETADSLRKSLETTVKINEDSLQSNINCMGMMAGTGAGKELSGLLDLERGIQDVLFISIHINSNLDSSLHGTGVYYVTDESIAQSTTEANPDPEYTQYSTYAVRDPYYGRNGEKSSLLAQSIYDAITGRVPALTTNGHETIADNFAVLREQNLPGVMVETGYLTNDDDRRLLLQSSTWEKIGDGITEGCIRYFSEMD